MVVLHRFPVFFALILLFSACTKKEFYGDASIHFAIQVDGDDVRYHLSDYQNVAGNRYKIDEVKFFISDVAFITHSGEKVKVATDDGIHYFDSNIPSTFDWNVKNLIEGQYDSITFVFGLLPEQNVTGYFVNPPENNMAWPDVLGGGYHYMQINGTWLAANDTVKMFNLHTGIGQIYDQGEITSFVPNFFTVSLPLNSFAIDREALSGLQLVMNVNEWFSNPNVFDLDEFGGSIMQNQAAQQLLRENGKSVFSIR